MKAFVVLACLAVAAFAKVDRLHSDLSHDDDWPAFQAFVKSYGRTYTSALHVNERFLIFKENVRLAAIKQAGDKHAQWGVTKFMDLTPAEFQKDYLIGNFTSPKLRGEKVPMIPAKKMSAEDAHTFSRAGGYPVTYDWNQKNAVTAVYNQGSCGSCWAFSTTEHVESMWAINGGGLQNLAMQELVDCDGQSNGCAGGNPPNAFAYLMQVGGEDSLSSYPYTGVDGTCEFNPSTVGARVTNWGYITTSDDEAAMANWIYTTGPPSACLCASQWQYYQGGVITGAQCCTKSDHCIQITGWTSMDGMGAWTIRNSWGTNWGYSGYLYLEYGTNTCGVGGEVTGCSV